MAWLPWEIAGSAVALAGSTMGAVGQYKAEMANAQLKRDRAAQEGVKRRELGYRALSNLRTQRLQAEQQMGQTDAIRGGSGIAVDDSASLETRQNARDIIGRNRADAIREHSYEAQKSVTEGNYLLKQASIEEKSAKITLASNLLIAAGNAAIGVGGSIRSNVKSPSSP